MDYDLVNMLGVGAIGVAGLCVIGAVVTHDKVPMVEIPEARCTYTPTEETRTRRWMQCVTIGKNPCGSQIHHRVDERLYSLECRDQVWRRD